MAAEDLEWERSKISNQDVNMLKRLGLMKKEDAIRFPTKKATQPSNGVRVSFVDHLIRGLSAPIHDFLRGLLFVYGIQLHHDDEEVPTVDVAPRTSTSHTVLASDTLVEGEESSPPQQNVVTTTPPSSLLAPSPKRARIETFVEPAPQLGSSSTLLLDDPMIKELLRIGSQFIGYREYASRAEDQTNQDFDLENPVDDPLLGALSYLEHGSEIREGVANANAGLSALFPYFFPKKEALDFP
ncbi:hypothetical protein QYE76_070541 [Lolium multiflorum]|uniref:Uncharacterized protein n=1 Tax=Lolium multiflorum TaxID=4521 RepID=A0AAD8SJT8_LOLMU|nr:hypothetical protein QYE76_070541 [Lolium multiflorum]